MIGSVLWRKRLYRAEAIGLVARDLLGRRETPRENSVHLGEAARWIARASEATPDAGVSAGYGFEEGWFASYPETTGYIIPTLLTYAEYSGEEDYTRQALAMADWLLTVQLAGAGFPGHFVDRANPLWHRLLGGQRPSLAGYVTGTGPKPRAPAAGGRSCCLSSLSPRPCRCATGPGIRACAAPIRSRPSARSRRPSSFPPRTAPRSPSSTASCAASRSGSGSSARGRRTPGAGGAESGPARQDPRVPVAEGLPRGLPAPHRVGPRALRSRRAEGSRPRQAPGSRLMRAPSERRRSSIRS